MKILLVHEFYRSASPSGEDTVFRNEKALLKSNGLEVNSVEFQNDSLERPEGPSVVEAAFLTLWSGLGTNLVNNSIKKFRPDVVHFHNVFPVISPSAIWQAKKVGIATIQTLHNFRYFCAQAMLIRSGKICELCIGRYPWPGLAFRCYRNSFFATMPLILSIALHRYLLTWQKKIDRFIVLSEFNKSKFVDAGIPIHKIRVKPNFVKSADVPLNRRDNYWVFIGRIKEEKGIQLLPRVWKHLGECAPILHVLGDGPFLNTLKLIVLKCNLEKKIILHGQCSSEKVQEILRSAKLMILPSICYEGFPMVVVEAYEAGVPVAASRLGSLADIVKHQLTGILFQPGDIEDMAKKLQHLANNQSALIEMSVNARKEYDSNYGSQKNFDKLREIYLEAIEDNHKLNNSANKKSISQ